VALALVCAVATSAAARSLAIDGLDVQVVVGRDASIDVTEVIHARFSGAWNGIYRTIPVVYRTSRGFGYRLVLDPLAVTDADGRPLRWEAETDRHYRKFKLWIPDARDAARTVVFRYRVRNALRFFEDHDELYWNVTGDEWDVPIARASARISLPPGASGIRAAAFTGVYGSGATEADVETADDAVVIRMRRPLGFHEGLTAVVGWDKGAVQPPGPIARAALFLRANWPLGMPVGVFGLMLGQWYRRGRDPRRRPIAPRYEPPDGLTPAEVGTLVDHRADVRDITATLVDLAVRGFIVIEEEKRDGLLGRRATGRSGARSPRRRTFDRTSGRSTTRSSPTAATRWRSRRSRTASIASCAASAIASSPRSSAAATTRAGPTKSGSSTGSSPGPSRVPGSSPRSRPRHCSAGSRTRRR